MAQERFEFDFRKYRVEFRKSVTAASACAGRNAFAIRGRVGVQEAAECGDEHWPYCFLTTRRECSSQRVSEVCRTLSRRSLREELLLLGSVLVYGFRATNLSGEPPRYRVLLGFCREEALPHGLPQQGCALHFSRCE